MVRDVPDYNFQISMLIYPSRECLSFGTLLLSLTLVPGGQNR